MASDSTSHQAVYCISAEECVTSVPRDNGKQRIASELSSALDQTVYCIRQYVASDSVLYQTVRCIRQCITSDSAWHQIASESASHQAVRCISQYIISDSTLQQTVHGIRQRVVSVPSKVQRQYQGPMSSSVSHQI